MTRSLPFGTSSRPCFASSAVMSSSLSQIGTSTASVTLSFASMNCWRRSCRRRLSPTVGITSAAARVAAFSFRFTMMRPTSANVGCACDALFWNKNRHRLLATRFRYHLAEPVDVRAHFSEALGCAVELHAITLTMEHVHRMLDGIELVKQLRNRPAQIGCVGSPWRRWKHAYHVGTRAVFFKRRKITGQ